jgi:hypothetical protein
VVVIREYSGLTADEVAAKVGARTGADSDRNYVRAGFCRLALLYFIVPTDQLQNYLHSSLIAISGSTFVARRAGT